MRKIWVSLLLVAALDFSCAGADRPRAPSTSAVAPAPLPDPAPSTSEVRVAPGRYPETPADDVVEEIFGEKVRDPYRWLEDPHSPKVQAWMDAEDQLARNELAKLPGRNALVARLRSLFYVETVSPPIHRGNRFFYTRRQPDAEKAIVYFREGKRGPEQVLIDPNRLSDTGDIALHGWVPTLDGKRVAYSLHKNNADYGTLQVMEVSSRIVSSIDTIDNVRSAGSWVPSGDGFYYTHYPRPEGVSEADRSGEAVIRFHRLGTDPATDPVVREKTSDPKRLMSAQVSRDGHWLILQITRGTSANDVYFRDLRRRTPTWLPLVLTTAGKSFSVIPWKDRFYIRTNDGADNYHVYQVDPRHPERERWIEIVPENTAAVLQGMAVVGGQLSLTYLREVKPEIELHSLSGKLLRKLALPGVGATSGLVGDPAQDDAYYSFSSFLMSPTVYQTSIKRGTSSAWFSVHVPIDPTPYTIEQVWAQSKDGTKISIFVGHRKDIPKDGSTPFLLTGYGGFNIPQLPAYSSSIYPWLEAGGGYALVNLRGGNEFGESWHKAGMKGLKQNVFDDFVAAAEHLVKNGFTKPEHLAIRGGSNGGLLVGAAMIQRPDLFRAVICAVPLLDMVRYHRFGLGKLWISEYGSAENEAEFKALYAYSPYHHVASGKHYPAVLMLSADSDDRVDPLHARKMTAALQASASDRPVLLRIERNASHGGADLIRQQVEQNADVYTFLMSELGMNYAKRAASAAVP